METEFYGASQKDFFLEVSGGNVPGYSIVKKFGAIDNVTASLTPVATAGVYRTPSTATALEILSSSTDDDISGTGATTVTVEGLGSDWLLQSETISMDGTTAVALANSYTRVFRMYLGDSGSYASASSSSHAGTLTLRESGGGDTWANIVVDAGFGLGQSLIGAYTVPKGKTGYLFNQNIGIESGKVVSAYFFSRLGADVVSAPYSPMRIKALHRGAGTLISAQPQFPMNGFTGPCDIGFMAKTAASTSDVDVTFELLLIDDGE